MCFWNRPERKYHPCILMGSVIYGKPVASFNRRVLDLGLTSGVVQAGTYGAVRAGGGQINQVQWLGRVTVPFEQQLSIVEQWVNEAFKETGIPASEDAVIAGVQARMNDTGILSTDVESVQLDIFRAVIVNRMEDKVFVYKTPTSFPQY